MLGGVEPWEDTGIGGILGDPDNDRDSWDSLEQGISRSYESGENSEGTGDSENRKISEYGSEVEGVTGTGFDRGYNPQKDDLKNRQTVRERQRFERKAW